MKKKYLLLSLLCISSLGFSQDFKIDFEGVDPLNNLPAGVTHVHASGDIVVVNSQDPNKGDNNLVNISQVNSEVIVDANNSENKVLLMDYQGYLALDETALGTESFTVGGYYDPTDNTGQFTGFMTIAGNNGTSWNRYQLIQKYANGTMDGFAFTTNAVNGFPVLTSALDHFIISFDHLTGLFKLYKNGALVATSANDTKSVAGWTGRKLYLGYKGGTIGTDGVLPPAYDGNGRCKDTRTKLDDITVFKRTITDAEALTLYTEGSLAINQLTNEYFNAYPNPVVDYLNFSTNDVYSVEIYNTLGAKISTQKVANGVNMTQFIQGVYIVKCKDKSEAVISTIRVVKK